MSDPSPLPLALPEEVGLSSARLARVGVALNRAIDHGRVPGVVALVARRGKLAYFESFGRRNPAAAAAMSEDSIFRIYSMTKPIVSVAVMMLAEEGRLLIADPLAHYVPEFAQMKVAAGGEKLELVLAERPITLLDLLRHTSGVTYEHMATGAAQQLYREARVARRDQSNAELAVRLAGLPLVYQPATHWQYGHSTDLLGRVIEVVTGKRLSEALAAMVLQPLGMVDTGFAVAPGQSARLAEPFPQDPDSGAPVNLLPVKDPPQFESGGGGLVSTAADYARFLAMLANGGSLDSRRLLGRKTIERMSADHLGPIPGDPPMLPIGYGFGLGFAVRRQTGIANMAGSAGEYYWGGVAGTAFWIDPREELFAVLMLQGPGQREYFRLLFRNLVYGAIVD
jgi:CubicO group peptidase (beta-lactamase class C family)